MTRILTSGQRAAMPLILAVIADRQGQSTAELAFRLGRSGDQVRRAAAALRDAGQLVLLRYGQGRASGWFTPAEGVRARQEGEKIAAEKRRAKNRVWSAQHWVKTKAIRQAEREGPEITDAPVQRWVDAHAPLPFQCRAPASVFAWRPAA